MVDDEMLVCVAVARSVGLGKFFACRSGRLLVRAPAGAVF